MQPTSVRERLRHEAQGNPSLLEIVDHALSRMDEGRERIVNSDIGKIEALGALHIAKDLARLAHERNPENIFFVVKYGSLLLKNDQVAEAHNFLREYRRKYGDPTNRRFWTLYASVLKHLERYDDAIGIYLRLLEEPAGDHAYVRHGLAETYYLAGNFKAIQDLLGDDSLTPDEALWLGKALVQQGEPEGARDLLRPFLGKEAKVDEFFTRTFGPLERQRDAQELPGSGAAPLPELRTPSVFLVHGRNEGIRETVARFLERLGLNVTILHEKPGRGRTLIEKFVEYSDVSFAVVLLTGDDRGGPQDQPPEAQRARPRQNVLLELGFFLGKLGRSSVCALYEQGVEIPSDYGGVQFVPLDDGWRLNLAKELKAAELPVDLNLAVS